MGRVKHHIKASTLIEVLIALIIIVVVSTLASTFIVNTYKKTNTSFKIRAFLILDNEVERTLHDKDFVDEIKEVDIYKIEKSIIATDNTLLSNIIFKITDKEGRVIIERKRIVIMDTVFNYINEKN